ncbi:unnamed protein product [Caenorhabditis bovis]|uniref:Uncharacterized protein n=1 Tax=Caenorhabditis bovis TaxID=2654633 RepID=A0A8S1EV20_9PELO|nr:unnamed protein product [Caenorhabditis bovis]
MRLLILLLVILPIICMSIYLEEDSFRRNEIHRKFAPFKQSDEGQNDDDYDGQNLRLERKKFNWRMIGGFLKSIPRMFRPPLISLGGIHLPAAQQQQQVAQ